MIINGRDVSLVVSRAVAVFSEYRFAFTSLWCNFLEEVIDDAAGCLGNDREQRGSLASLDVNRCLPCRWMGRVGRRRLCPRLEVNFWKRVARHSLVGALAVEVVDIVDVHRSILMSAYVIIIIIIIIVIITNSSNHIYIDLSVVFVLLTHS